MDKKKRIDLFEEWLRDRELSENTIKNYMHSVKEYFSMFDELNKKNLITYKNELLGKNSPKTVNLRCVAMNQYCIFTKNEKLCVKQVKIHKKASVENVVTLEEYERIISYLRKRNDKRYYFMILLMAKTGARVSELIRFKRSDMERRKCEIWTKGKIRTIYIPDRVAEEALEYFQEDGYLFKNRCGKPITTRGVAGIIKKIGEELGIQNEKMHPHSFRHLFAIEFLKKNKNIALLADLMGHESVNTTAIYLRLSEKEQIEQLNEAME